MNNLEMKINELERKKSIAFQELMEATIKQEKVEDIKPYLEVFCLYSDKVAEYYRQEG